MDLHRHRDLTVLEAVAEDQHLTQRSLAARLGIALGLANLFVKRLVRKGYIKCVNVRANRIRYLVTPKGLTAKARLTIEFLEHSVKLYAQARAYLRGVLAPHLANGHQRFVIYGTGEAAALAYISLRELGLEPLAIFDDDAESHFLGMPVRPLAEHVTITYDLMIVASLDRSRSLVARLIDAGVSEAKLCTLRSSSGWPVSVRSVKRPRAESGKVVGP